MVGASPSAPPPDSDRARVVVVYGGRSAEHDVSCISARFVLGALDPDRYQVELLGVTREGAWVNATEVLAAAAPGHGRGAGSAAGAGLPSPGDLDAPGVDPVAAVRGRAPGRSTVVFPVIHGPTGEDGTIQGVLEVADVAYVGPGVLGSALAMDKGVAKTVLGAAGLPQVRYVTLRTDEIGPDVAALVDKSLGWPVFVKPANLGSTIGISRADDPEALMTALDLALAYDEYVVIEEAVEAREIELGVLGHVELRVTEPGETVPSHDFYDFEDKYLAGSSRLLIPAPIPPAVAIEARALAVQACRALRVEGMARVDFFYEDPGRGLLLNEVNTIPGLTDISLYPRAWAAGGLDGPALVDELLDAARSRYARRRALRTTR